ncbi:hypothetical protein ASD40_19900 [Paenibacillus sp. Root444D2]|nr:hypothetical protein ASD40_19900 [Paenibacillus sp. Root444D2]KRE45549.1 hypothetical protein ASG85_05810 [Paenibacillus sp. Soil724D2]
MNRRKPQLLFLRAVAAFYLNVAGLHFISGGGIITVALRELVRSCNSIISKLYFVQQFARTKDISQLEEREKDEI